MAVAQLAHTRNTNTMMTKSIVYSVERLAMVPAQRVRALGTNMEAVQTSVFIVDRQRQDHVLAVRMGNTRNRNG